MPDNQTSINGLIKSLDKSNPDVMRALQLMSDELYKIKDAVFPRTAVVQGPAATITADIDTPTTFAIATYPNSLRMSWDLVDGALSYEIRLGTLWDTAVYVLTTGASAVNFDPKERNLTSGSYTFLIKSRNVNGQYCINAASALVSIGSIPAPVLTVNVIANNVLLSWTQPSSTWDIDYYILYKNAVEIGRSRSIFKMTAEITGGTFSYTVKAVDIVGNLSTLSNAVSITVTDPLDFIRVGTVNAGYSGTYSNAASHVYLGITGVLGSIIIETWQDHFINNAWTTPQDQINASYPLYFEPSNTTDGYYEEVFDFGSTLSNATFVALYDFLQLAGTTTITVTMSSSTDNITYTSPATGTSLFAASARYVKIRWTFHNADHFSLAFISNLRAAADVQLTIDSGSGSAVSTDAGGTTINFNKTFKTVNSLTVGANEATATNVTGQTVGTTSFKVLAFDSGGTRKNASIWWKARGIT